MQFLEKKRFYQNIYTYWSLIMILPNPINEDVGLSTHHIWDINTKVMISPNKRRKKVMPMNISMYEDLNLCWIQPSVKGCFNKPKRWCCTIMFKIWFFTHSVSSGRSVAVFFSLLSLLQLNGHSMAENMNYYKKYRICENSSE